MVGKRRIPGTGSIYRMRCDVQQIQELAKSVRPAGKDLLI
jgi:hypothetical protein